VKEHQTTVPLADDHTMFREGLAGLLTSYEGMEVVGEPTNDEGVYVGSVPGSVHYRPELSLKGA
jgi:hypothetical protein